MKKRFSSLRELETADGHLCSNGVLWPIARTPSMRPWLGDGGCPNCDRNYIEQIERSIARTWLREFTQATDRFHRMSSYGLKHEAERSEHSEHWRYVSNGALILAAFDLGYSIRVHSTSPNVQIGLRFRKVSS